MGVKCQTRGRRAGWGSLASEPGATMPLGRVSRDISSRLSYCTLRWCDGVLGAARLLGWADAGQLLLGPRGVCMLGVCADSGLRM